MGLLYDCPGSFVVKPRVLFDARRDFVRDIRVAGW
jgi:hypothetical protein